MDKQEAFSNKMLDILNHGALNLGLALGYRLRLFEAMSTFDSPETCHSLAKKGKVSERYLREWLGIMVTGGVIELSESPQGEELYFLPPEHAAYLVRGSEVNLGVYTQETPLLTRCAQEGVERAFRIGGGVPWSNYRPFAVFMGELADAKHRATLVEGFMPYVDQGKIKKRLEAGIDVCDLGCGSGFASLLMARAFPNSRFVGLDIDEGAIDAARARAAGENLENLTFLVADAARLADDAGLAERFDYITAFDSIHDQSHPADALLSVRHLLRPGGVFSMVDIAAGSRHCDNIEHPMGPFLYTVSLMHCMPVGLNDNGTGLGMMWGRALALKMLAEAGFSRIEVEEIPFDPFNLHFLCRK